MAQIPVQLTSFVGREWEVDEVKRLLAQTRLLTLTGSGGCGKTRLAAEVAAGMVATFADGPWWVELAGLSEPALVPQAIAQALGLPETANQSLSETLINYLRSRRALLVLDNCEHLVGTCAPLAESLLRAAPELRILTTSRQALGVAGEVIWFVPSLSLPEPGSEPDDGALALLQYDAVRLFVERARAVLPSFALAEDDTAAVVQVCRRLDGIPLAIELAAARVRLLQVEQIATRLDDRFRLLTGGSATVLSRHQTLRAAIEWSYDLLSEPERQLFHHLAVFAGSFSLEAAESICAGPAYEMGDVLDLLTQLTNKSLVVVERAAGQAPRFRLLETIRQYALIKLCEAGETELAQRRHRDYFLALAEAAEPHLIGPAEMAWLERLDREHDNFCAALSWPPADETADGESGLRLAGALAEFWIRRGYLVEGRNWLASALANQGLAPLPVQAKLLWKLGSLLRHQGDASQAISLLQESLALYQKAGDDIGVAWVLWELSICAHYYQNDVAQGLAYLERSRKLAREADDKELLSAVYAQLGLIAMRQKAHDQAADWYEQSLALARETGSQKLTATLLFYAGWAALNQDDRERATTLLQESLALARQLKDRALVQTILGALGELARLQQEYGQAAALYEESLAQARELGLREGTAPLFHNLGHIALHQGQTQAARSLFVESLVLSQELGHKEFISWCLAGLAGVAAAEGQPARAARLFGAADALLAAIHLHLQGVDRVEYDHNLAIARTQLDEVAFGTARAEGQALSLEEAIAYALEKGEGPPVAVEKEVVPETPVLMVPARPELCLLALGPAQVYRGDRLLVAADWTFAKPKELLFYLLCHPPRTKEQIGLVFWPDAAPEQLRGSLRATLYRLRQALGRPEWILFEDGRYSFNRSLDYWFDVEAFMQHLAQAKRLQASVPEQAVHYLSEAIKLYQGDFLAELAADEWCWSRREELREQFMAALLSLGQLYMAAGHYREAAETYRQALSHDNWLEAVHRELLRCYARLGERRRAMHHYQTLINLLSDELGVSPEPETAALFERLRLGGPV